MNYSRQKVIIYEDVGTKLRNANLFAPNAVAKDEMVNYVTIFQRKLIANNTFLAHDEREKGRPKTTSERTKSQIEERIRGKKDKKS